MHASKHMILPVFVAFASATHIHVPRKAPATPAAVLYSTIVTNVVSTVTSTSPITIDTGIETTGPATLIPGALTIDFSAVPAYVYIETYAVTTVLKTKKITTSVPYTTKGTSPTTTPKRSTTSNTVTKKPSTSSQAGYPSGTPHPGNLGPCQITTYTWPSGENSYTAWCGSGRECYDSYCYYFAVDPLNCGGIGNVCKSNETCYYKCVDTQNDVNNCGRGGLVCGDAKDYGCVKGQCVGLSWDPNNCGKVGNVCSSGSCTNYKCD